MQIDPPKAFRDRIIAARHGDGARWLESLPEVVAALAEQWDLSLGEPFEPSWSYVVSAQRATGEACVLKIQLPADGEDPWAEGPAREARTLRLAGPSAVRLLEEDSEAGALLLERASGGPLAPMAGSDDDRATEILATAMVGFWAPAGEESGLPPVSRLEESFEEFDRGPHGSATARVKDLVTTLADIDAGLRDLRAATVTARRVFEELLADKRPSVVIHGDLHHDNVLEDEARGWVVVDPKGYFGDAGFDTGAMLYNPMFDERGPDDVGPRLRRRMIVMSGIVGIDVDLLAPWGYLRTVISLVHTLEDGGELHRDDVRMRTIESLRQMI